MSDDVPIRRRIPPQVPTLRDLAAVLFRRRRTFVWAAGLVFAAAVLCALLGTTYQGSMKILVRRGRADAPVSAAQNAPLDVTRMNITEEELNSEVELLRDDDVLRNVVAAAGAGGRDWLRFLHLRETPAQRAERAARRLAGKLQVDPVRKTNLIAVRYTAGDPQEAAKVLQSLADAYLQKHLAVHRPQGESRFFDQQIAESAQQMETSQQKLLGFASGHAIVVAARQRDLALQRLSDMESSARQTEIEVAETQRRVSALENLLAQLPERTTTQVRSADNPELMKSLKASLLELQLKRTQLLTKFEPGHRLVQEVDQQIAQTQSAISAEGHSPVREETTDKNSQFQWAQSELQQAQVKLGALEARQTAAAAQVAAYQTLAERLGADAVTQDDLVARVKAAQENYLLYLKKREQARIDDALDERGIVNVAIAEQPAAPALPVRSAWTVLMIGLLTAGVAGTGAAFAVDYLDPAFRNPDDVEACLQAPVLASLPKEEQKRLAA